MGCKAQRGVLVLGIWGFRNGDILVLDKDMAFHYWVESAFARTD